MSRVVFVHPGHFPPRLDYPESRPMLLARDLGHDVHGVCLPMPGRPELEGVTLWTAGPLRERLALIRRLQADLVFIEMPTATMLAALGARRSWVRALQRRDSVKTDLSRGLIVGRVDAVSFTNPHDRSQWPQVRQRQLRALPYAVDVAGWREPVQRRESFWTERGLEPPTGPVITTIANISAVKQYPQLVQWAAPFLRERPGARLVLPGYRFDREEHARVVRLVEELDLTGRVDLIGQVPPADIKQLLGWADAHVVNSLRETQCMAMYESVAAGVPTLLHDSPTLTSAFPTLPVHRDERTLHANLTAVLDDPAAARAALQDERVQRRLAWADQPQHDEVFTTGLAELLG